jgi:hypothetical protein
MRPNKPPSADREVEEESEREAPPVRTQFLNPTAARDASNCVGAIYWRLTIAWMSTI